LIRGLALHAEDPFPQIPMGLDPQEALTQHDEARDVQYGIGVQVMHLGSVGKKKASEEIVRRKRKSAEDECHEHYRIPQVELESILVQTHGPPPHHPSGALIRLKCIYNF
jgi:hypothetical protein